MKGVESAKTRLQRKCSEKRDVFVNFWCFRKNVLSAQENTREKNVCRGTPWWVPMSDSRGGGGLSCQGVSGLLNPTMHTTSGSSIPHCTQLPALQSHNAHNFRETMKSSSKRTLCTAEKWGPQKLSLSGFQAPSWG